METENLQENELAHDIREINKQLKPQVEKVREFFKRNRNLQGTREREAIAALQCCEMITKRLDVYDFYKNKSAIDVFESRFNVHRVIMKVTKILEGKSRSGKVEIEIGGSYCEITASKKIEVAFFVLLENAVKYSPPSQKVNVGFNESETMLIIEIENYGPQLEEDEVGCVFDYGFRGKRSKKYQRNGAGIGLHFAHDFFDYHGFSIHLTQNRSDTVSIKGTNFSRTIVRVEIPKTIQHSSLADSNTTEEF